MQIPILTIQTNNSPLPQPKAQVNGGAQPDIDFQRTLSRQMAQRPSPDGTAHAQSARITKKPLGQAPAVADKPSVADQAVVAEQRSVADPIASSKGAKAAPSDSGESDEPVALAGPVADMLALVASFNQAAVLTVAHGVATKPQAPALPAAARPDSAALPAIAQVAGAIAVKTDATIDIDSLPASKVAAPDNAVLQGLTAMTVGAVTVTAKALAAPDTIILPATAGKIARPDVATVQRSTTLTAGSATVQAKAAPDTPELPELPENKLVLSGTTAAPGIAQLAPSRLPATMDMQDRADALPLVKEPPPSIVGMTVAPQAAFDINLAASAIPGDKLHGRVGSNAWDQQLGQKIVWMVAGAEHSATLTLNPPDLGPLQVVLNVSNDHTDATFTSARPEVCQALEAAMPKLREIMSDAGMQLGNTTVSAGMPERDPGARGEASTHQGGAEARTHRDGSTGGAASAAQGAVAATRMVVQGLVDTFA